MSTEPAWEQFREIVLDFTGGSQPANDNVFTGLSDRERDILVGLTEGRTNAEIGTKLFISDKTVRNTLTRLYEKLGVKTRAQAIVLARDRGFRS